MVASFPSSTHLADALRGLANWDVSLPAADDDAVSDGEFLDRADSAWQACDRFDLQTDVLRGQILRAVRDRQKRSGEGRGTGFLNWLREREISKSQAYSLIELADSADKLQLDSDLDPATINKFSKRAFVEVAKADPEVQQIVLDAAKECDRITRREVRQLSEEWTAMTSDLLPDEVKARAADNSLPARYLAPLVRHLEKLPKAHQAAIRQDIARNPDADSVKHMATEARNLAKYLEAAARVQTLREAALDIEMALEEALRVGCLSLVADMVNQAAQLEQTTVRLYTTWKRLSSISDRLYVDTGATTPSLRSLIRCLERLSQDTIEVTLGEDRDRTIRLQIFDGES
ncbi:MAG: hypothetical protein HC925_06040 [Coleofasciculaceae cyanobacterium SM2_3_26]|nr:hypothetical protein [Coleofasciculaceae cyanobacterium SM2_3_26]